MSIPESFCTPRLQAERLTSDHLIDLVRFHRDPAVMAELGGVRDEEQTSQYLSRNLHHWREYGFGPWILREIDGEEVVGRAVLRHLVIEGVNEVEVGFALYPRFWGRGLATEVAETCLRFARRELRLGSLVAVTTVTNRASQRVLAKIGFLQERELTLDHTRCSLFRTRWQFPDTR